MVKKIAKTTVAMLVIGLSASIMPVWAAQPAQNETEPAVNSSLLTIESTENPLKDETTGPAAAAASASADNSGIRTIGKSEPGYIKAELTNNSKFPVSYICIFENDPESELYRTLIDVDYELDYDDEDLYVLEEDVYDEEAEEIKEIQRALIQQGFLDGEADGSYGPMTQAAVEAFRAANNLPAGTETDDEMLMLLFADYDDGNFLEDGEQIAPKEKVIISYPAAEKDDKDNAEGTETVSVETDDIYPETDYLMIVRFLITDEDNDVYEDEYLVHFIPSDTAPVISLDFSEDEFAYIEYTDPVSKKTVSTYDIEKAVFEFEFAEWLAFEDMYDIEWIDDEEYWEEDDDIWEDDDWDDEYWDYEEGEDADWYNDPDYDDGIYEDEWIDEDDEWIDDYDDYDDYEYYEDTEDYNDPEVSE